MNEKCTKSKPTMAKCILAQRLPFIHPNLLCRRNDHEGGNFFSGGLNQLLDAITYDLENLEELLTQKLEFQHVSL